MRGRLSSSVVDIKQPTISRAVLTTAPSVPLLLYLGNTQSPIGYISCSGLLTLEAALYNALDLFYRWVEKA